MSLSTNNNTREVGNITEQLALRYLIDNGLTLVAQNFSVRLGEIDLILKENNTIIFVEVKYRKNTNYGFPEETVTVKKQKKIRATALLFIAKNFQYKNFQPRFDVVALLPKGSSMSINWIKNAF